ncbi:MAG: hypothetical protein A2428_13685 [Bdellovibrionales bacterium RIFOXYC1_FULL_54_43]|nr:MAG: hypothetical protein A2428_13685 [Bdellovibrionales bacterium RIFOXYC1_FULL_54_43]OFZ80012.1 MAG: hypothetical protein A2603_02250 [Bdellovibrionales bacterium RIFOXYD1_FULL_55_31]
MGTADKLKGAFNKGPLIVVILNVVVALGAAGVLFYTKLVYKRPAITEHGERTRLASVHASPGPLATPATITFEPVIVNIEPVPQQPRAADGTSQQIEGKLHYSTVGFALEIRDGSKKEVIETLRPIIMDKFISLLGRKGFKELTTVQGRYLLRTQLLESVNQIVAKASEEAARDGLVTNIYFTQFIVQ